MIVMIFLQRNKSSLLGQNELAQFKRLSSEQYPNKIFDYAYIAHYTYQKHYIW